MEKLCPLFGRRCAEAETREDTMIPETPASPSPSRSPVWLPTPLDLNWLGGFTEGTRERLNPENG